jgi:hypothetical protein
MPPKGCKDYATARLDALLTSAEQATQRQQFAAVKDDKRQQDGIILSLASRGLRENELRLLLSIGCGRACRIMKLRVNPARSGVARSCPCTQSRWDAAGRASPARP